MLLAEHFDDEDQLLSLGSVADIAAHTNILNIGCPVKTLARFIRNDLEYWAVGFRQTLFGIYLLYPYSRRTFFILGFSLRHPTMRTHSRSCCSSRHFWNTMRDSWVALLSMSNPENPEFYDVAYPVTDAELGEKAVTAYNQHVALVNQAHTEVLEVLPEWKKDDEQSVDSWTEQTECMSLVSTRLKVIESTMDATTAIPSPRPILIIGPPGCGKTFLAHAALRDFDTATKCEGR